MWQLDIRNIAGIRQGEAAIEPGINAVQASNWQGKSSLIAAIKTAMGTATPLTAGESAGKVEIDTENGSYRVELRRENGHITREGEPYLDDEQDLACAELFAFLDESNEIREAVRTGGDLKPLLTRPLDLENIDQQIRDLQRERDRIDRELGDAEQQANRQDTLQEQVTQLETELEELREERETLEDSVDSTGDADREALNAKRTEYERTKRTIEQNEERIERLEGQLEEKQSELAELEVPEEADIDAELREKEQRHDELQTEVELFESIYNTNKRILDDNQIDVVTEIDRELAGDTVACWVCGHEADRSGIEERLEALEERIADRRSSIAEMQGDIQELEAKQQQQTEAERRERRLEESVEDIERRLSETRADLEDATDRVDALESEIAELEETVAATDNRADELESEITRVEVRLEDARGDLEAAEAAADEAEQLRDQREEVAGEIVSLRERKENVISDLVDSFEEAIDDVIEQFEPSFERARLVEKDDEFQLVIARDGREVSIDALSEGEVELLGFMVALAGFLCYEVTQRVPVILLDSVGGLAGEHLRRLVDYLESSTEAVVTTAYPEQGMLGESVLSPENWQVVSDRG
jgi:DNA repair exonuclease SbcCD ATPase subunit